MTKPFHKLSKHQYHTLALLLYYFDKFKYELNNEDLAWKLTFDYDTKLKIKEELGWEPSLAFEEGLSKTIDWYLNNKDWLDNVTSGTYRT